MATEVLQERGENKPKTMSLVRIKHGCNRVIGIESEVRFFWFDETKNNSGSVFSGEVESVVKM